MNKSILHRLDKLEAEKGKIHKIIFYCENLDGHQKIFETREEAIAYEKQHPGWYAEMKISFPNGHEIIWNNATLYRMRKAERKAI